MITGYGSLTYLHTCYLQRWSPVHGVEEFRNTAVSWVHVLFQVRIPGGGGHRGVCPSGQVDSNNIIYGVTYGVMMLLCVLEPMSASTSKAVCHQDILFLCTALKRCTPMCCLQGITTPAFSKKPTDDRVFGSWSHKQEGYSGTGRTSCLQASARKSMVRMKNLRMLDALLVVIYSMWEFHCIFTPRYLIVLAVGMSTLWSVTWRVNITK